MAKYVSKKTKTTRINPDTGEIFDTSETLETFKTSTDPFFSVYTGYIQQLYGSSILNATTKVLFKLLEYSEFDTGKAHIDANRIEEIKLVCKIGKTSYHKAIKTLMKEEIISKEGSSYRIRADMFWKGNRATRAAAMPATCKLASREGLVITTTEKGQDE